MMSLDTRKGSTDQSEESSELHAHPPTFPARGPTLEESRLHDLDAVIAMYDLKPSSSLSSANEFTQGETQQDAESQNVDTHQPQQQTTDEEAPLWPAPTLKVFRCKQCLRAFLSEEAREEHMGNSLVCEQPPIPRSVRQRTHAKVFPDSVCNEDYEDESYDPERAALYRIALQAAAAAASSSTSPTLLSSSPSSRAETIVNEIAAKVRQVRSVLAGSTAAVRPSGQGGQKLTKRVRLLRDVTSGSGGVSGDTVSGLASLVGNVSALGSLGSDVAAALTGDMSGLSADGALAVAALVDQLDHEHDHDGPNSGGGNGSGNDAESDDDSLPTRAWTGHLKDNLGLSNSHSFDLANAANVVAAAAAAGTGSDKVNTSGHSLSALALVSLVSSSSSSNGALRSNSSSIGGTNAGQSTNEANVMGSFGGSHGEDDDGENRDPWKSPANEVISFRFVASESELHSTKSTFKPTFSHQIFHEEQIYGYKGLSVDLYFTAGSLYPYFAFRYKDVKPSLPPMTEEESKDVAAALARLTYRPPDDIIGALAARLPASCFSTSLDEFKRRIMEPFNPPGTMIHTYTVPTLLHQHKGHRLESSFHIFRASMGDPDMRAFHERLQFFLLFYIDRSSYIDSNDQIWEVLLVVERLYNRTTHETSWRTVGYTTLYTFLNYPKGTRLRLSQILILPPYQRQGHGQQLLNSVFAEADRRDVVEVSIEDPAVGFQALRDLTDVTRCRDRGFFQRIPRTQSLGHPGSLSRGLSSPSPNFLPESSKDSLLLSLQSTARSFSGVVPSNSTRREGAGGAQIPNSQFDSNIDSSSSQNGFNAECLSDPESELQQVIMQAQRQPNVWSRKYAEYVRGELRITMAQVRRCYEIFRFASIDPRDTEELKAFRLDVKKRLFKDHEEELSIFVNDPEGRKKRLQELYQELEDSYRNVCKKARIR